MVRVYAFANQKGGVGKTTTAVNLGAYLAAAGQSVLLIDIDPQANATSSLGVDKQALTTSIYDVLVDGVELDQVIQLTNLMRLDLAPSAPPLAGAEGVPISQRTREHTPQSKLIEFLVAHLSGHAHLQDISHGAHPLDQDQVVA